MVHYRFLKELYFKSLTPFEILAVSKKNKYNFNKNEHFDYLDYWKKTISTENSDLVFQRYCTVNNLDHLDISIMLSNINENDQKVNFPAWILSLEEILSVIDAKYIQSIAELKNATDAFYHLFIPFIDYFLKKIHQNLTKSNVVLTHDLIDQVKIALHKDLLNVAYLILFDEFDQFKKENLSKDSGDDYGYKKFVSENLSNKYQYLFFKYPVLAKKLVSKTDKYIQFITNIFTRFEADKSDLEVLLNKKLDSVFKIYFNSGDLHNGESTVIIEFKNENKIVYKPSNIGITKAYNQFLNWINISLKQDLKTFKILDKETYGWIEFVENSPCSTIDDVQLYYERAGILLGIAYFLNSRDFHFENIIASGNSPVLIDHETILNPLIALQKGDETYHDTISGTVLESSLLPIKSLELPYYMYGFGSSTLLEGKIQMLKIKDYNKDTMAVIAEIEDKKLYKSNKPLFNNSIENLADYEEEFKTGFEKLYHLILENKEYLQSETSPIINFYNFKIRFINRQTKVYSKILKFLNKPEYLSDAIKYGIKLEILAKAYLVLNNWSSLLDFEREQMLQDDIPVFYIDALDNTINIPHKKSVNLIERNAIENIYDKLRNASIEDFKNQMMLIDDSIKL